MPVHGLHILVDINNMRDFHIMRPDLSMRVDIKDKIDNLNKPKGSLGILEELAEKICLVQQTLSPSLTRPCHLLFGGDHGIEREGVSLSPRAVTWQQMINFTRGGGGVNMFCRQHGFNLKIIDIGVDHDLSDYAAIRNMKIAYGTKDFLFEPAMSAVEMDKAIDCGAELVDECIDEGCNILCLGEMGIGNTSPSSVWLHLLGGVPLEECVGAGSGVAGAQLHHKYKILEDSVGKFKSNEGLDDTVGVIRYFGGFEMVGAIGAMLRAAERRILIMVDGFIMSACMLAASRLYPEVLDYAIFGHAGDEHAHSKMLSIMNATPLLNLGMRLGEGTGALCAYPIIESSVRMINEMNNFKNANITKYF